MIGKNYEIKKESVLELYEKYPQLRGNDHDGVNIKQLDKRIEHLKKSKFKIAVTGEVKAGKSTLINALLGETVLPTEVLQCSSEIVEIFYSKEQFVKVLYGDGHEVIIYDDLKTPNINEAYEYLRKVASVQEEYKKIPFIKLNEFLLNTGGNYRNDDIISLIERLENPYFLGKKEFEELIFKYLEKHKSLKEIPVNIQFGYPMKYSREIFFVDTPGVNAIGGIQDKTFNYISNADAIIFVHSVEFPVESETFRNFVNHITDNTKKHLLLVITKSNSVGPIELRRKFREIIDLYSHIIPEERIIEVDNILKFILDDIDRYSSIEGTLQYYKKCLNGNNSLEDNNYDFAHDMIICEIKLKLLENILSDIEDKHYLNKVKKKISQKANFKKLSRLIEEFSSNLLFWELESIVKSLKFGYKSQLDVCNDNIYLLEKQKEEAEEFEKTINEYLVNLNKFKEKIEEYLDMEIKQKYLPENAEWVIKLKFILEKLTGDLKEQEHEFQIRRTFTNTKDYISIYIKNIQEEISTKFRVIMEELELKFKKKKYISIPFLDLETIKSQCTIKEKDYSELKNIQEPGLIGGFMEWLTGTEGINKVKREVVRTFGEIGHLTYLLEVKILVLKHMDDICEKFILEINNLVINYLNVFEGEFSKLIRNREEKLKKMKEKTKKKEDLLRDMENLRIKKLSIEEELNKIESLKIL